MKVFDKFPKTPAGEEINTVLYDSQLRWSMLRSRWVYRARESFNAWAVRPMENQFFRQWLKQAPLHRQVEAMGLPYRSVDSHLNGRLDLSVNPSKLLVSLSMKASFPSRQDRNRAAGQFIWKGQWDLPRFDFQAGSRYRFIQDIWQHRHDLARSNAYRELLDQLEQGRPLRSHHKGILLNTPEKIMAYLQMYLGYMDSMARQGFDKQQGKDRLGVAIDRHGEIVKLNRGLHRLAMAQIVGLEDVVVRVRAVHELWWQDVTQGKAGEQALERMAHALPTCRPASRLVV